MELDALIIFYVILPIGLGSMVGVALGPRRRRELKRWVIKNVFGKLREIVMRSKKMKRVSTPADTFKWRMMIAGIFLLVIFIAGLGSHFSYVRDAKDACAARVGNDLECNYDYDYYVPEGLRALDKLNPSKLGIRMECRCNDEMKRINVQGKFRRWMK